MTTYVSSETLHHLPETAYLFLRPEYLRFHSPDNMHFFSLTTDSRLAAALAVSVVDKRGLSPYRATFGGVQLFRRVEAPELKQLYKKALDTLQQEGVTSFQVISCPAYLDPDLYAMQEQVLKDLGFRVAWTDVNYHVPLQGYGIHALHLSEKRRYKKCEKAGFRFGEWEQPDWAGVHAFICRDRAERQYPVSMTADDLQRAGTAFPDRYTVYRIMDGAEMCSLAVTVKVNNRVLYNFFPADNPAYKAYSPTVFLHLKVALHARQQGYEWYDLGIATESGVENQGLTLFKQRMGAIASEKIVLEKNL